MPRPLYVLLPADAEWSPVAGTHAQSPAPIRWYLRQHLPEATHSVAVLVPDASGEQATAVVAVLDQADAIGGFVVDAGTQQPVDRDEVRERI